MSATAAAMSHYDKANRYMNSLGDIKDPDIKRMTMQAAKDEFTMYNKNMVIVQDINKNNIYK